MNLPLTATALASAALVFVGVNVACNRPSPTWSATVASPRPDATGTTTRSIDNTGWIDNAGNSSDMYARTQMSGYRATEMGSERLTGTPGSGFPLEPAPKPTGREIGQGAGSASSELGAKAAEPSGMPSDEVAARIARARCDQAIACGRVGGGGENVTDATCMASERERSVREMDAFACERGFDAVQFAVCLAAVRSQPCGDLQPGLDNIEPCRANALCMRLP